MGCTIERGDDICGRVWDEALFSVEQLKSDPVIIVSGLRLSNYLLKWCLLKLLLNLFLTPKSLHKLWTNNAL